MSSQTSRGFGSSSDTAPKQDPGESFPAEGMWRYYSANAPFRWSWSGAFPPEQSLDWGLGCTTSSPGPYYALALVRRGVGVALAVSVRDDMPSRSVFESTTCITVEVGRWKRRSHEGEKASRFAAERETIWYCWGCAGQWRGRSVAALQRELSQPGAPASDGVAPVDPGKGNEASVSGDRSEATLLTGRFRVPAR